MPRVYYCTFCRYPIKPGTGLVYVKTDGTMLRFCSSKCYKSAIKYKRNPRKLKWTLSYGKR